MKILCAEQHTPEWFAARRGRVSASMAQVALAGRGTKGRQAYIHKLADDIEGIPDFDDVDIKPWFTDGIYYESWARGWYAFKFDVEVTQTGFVVHDDHGWLGCSPDGFVDKDYRDDGPGGCEIKYRKSLRSFHAAAQTGVTRTVNAQVQTSMFVTGRRWWDYINYWRSDDHDKEQGHVQRIYIDLPYIENTLLPAFVKLWQDVNAELRTRGVVAVNPTG